jgi:hypothetical protein
MIAVYVTTAEPNKPVGFIQEITYSGEFEQVKAIYESHGLGCVWSDTPYEIGTVYVDVASKQIKIKPSMTSVSDKDTIKSDGIDEVTIDFTPGKAHALVFFDGSLMHIEDITDGHIVLTADHSGEYTIHLTPDFPYTEKTITVKAN